MQNKNDTTMNGRTASDYDNIAKQKRKTVVDVLLMKNDKKDDKATKYRTPPD